MLGSVGEPINPEAWMWYHMNVGKEKAADCRYLVADGNRRHSDHAASGCHDPEAGFSLPAVLRRGTQDVLKDDGTPAGANEGGKLIIEKPWPGMLRGTYGDPENKRIKEVYFSQYAGNTLPVTAQGWTKTAITG